jgi:hypothetical protein
LLLLSENILRSRYPYSQNGGAKTCEAVPNGIRFQDETRSGLSLPTGLSRPTGRDSPERYCPRHGVKSRSIDAIRKQTHTEVQSPKLPVLGSVLLLPALGTVLLLDSVFARYHNQAIC